MMNEKQLDSYHSSLITPHSSFSFLEVLKMRLRKFLTATLCAALLAGALPAASLRASAAVPRPQNSAQQRLDIMRSRLETIRRTLNSAIAGLNAKDKGDGTADDPRTRLSGLEKETGKLLGEINDIKGKQDRAEHFDPAEIDKLEAAVTDLDNRSQVAMRETARDRTATGATAAAADAKAVKKSKKGGGFLGIGKIFGGSDSDKYAELVGTVAPGRDAQLFSEATKEARKDNYEPSRALYSVIINTYPDSVYLPLSKLAIADTFYLEGTTSALIQAGQADHDWVTVVPT